MCYNHIDNDNNDDNDKHYNYALNRPDLGGEEPGEQLAVRVVLDEMAGDHSQAGAADNLQVEYCRRLRHLPSRRQPGILRCTVHIHIYIYKSANCRLENTQKLNS